MCLKVLLNCNLPLQVLVTYSTNISIKEMDVHKPANRQCLGLPQALEQVWEIRVSWLDLPVGL